jgi:hypothetical protein
MPEASPGFAVVEDVAMPRKLGIATLDPFL